MGFPPNIKEKELISSARHCCVCHRFTGVNVEVHHIKQEADGGPNTFENAISLCFDCHSFAGHYNNRHPKETKYSQSELIKAKLNWHKLVKTNYIKPPLSDGKILSKYLVCKDFESFTAMLKGDFNNLPIKPPLLVKSPQGALVEKILARNEESFQSVYSFDKEYESEQAYLKQNPDVKKIESGGVFQYQRIPRREEFLARYNDLNGLIKIYLDKNVPIEYFASAEATFNDCGGDYEKVIETFSIKPIWCTFLLIENLSNTIIHFQEIEFNIHKNEEYVSIPPAISDLEVIRLKLPSVGVNHHQSILIPLGLILGEHDSTSREQFEINQYHTDNMDFVLSYSHEDYQKPYDYRNVGSFSYPRLVKYQTKDQELSLKIHNIDYSRFYTLDRHWLIGSCPHLILKNKNGTLIYAGEVFNKSSPYIETRTFVIEKDIEEFIITELEDETTFIKLLTVNHKQVIADTLLNKGEQLKILVKENDLIRVKGYYTPFSESTNNLDAIFQQNRLVKKYMNNAIID
ncbi:HNH endonuclease [Algoriphagus resistens]|uniref:HNH endonuclease n=1 Tax=Algoriphagus resistens TaxID=1750590 RepID=UPI000716A0BC|nr:HNH endonuclease [Algoriphagus resistens]